MFQRILHLTFMHRDLDQRFRIVDVSHNNIQYLYSLIWLDVPIWWSKYKSYVQNVGLYLVALSLCHVTHINHSACTNIFLITTMHRQLIPSIPSSCSSTFPSLHYLPHLPLFFCISRCTSSILKIKQHGFTLSCSARREKVQIVFVMRATGMGSHSWPSTSPSISSERSSTPTKCRFTRAWMLWPARWRQRSGSQC